jgi:hypothetical protein
MKQPPARPEIGLTIGSLALPGYTPRDGARLAGAFERELGRLLDTASLAQRGSDTNLLRIPRFRTHANESPERTGRRLARAVLQGLPHE